MRELVGLLPSKLLPATVVVVAHRLDCRSFVVDFMQLGQTKARVTFLRVRLGWNKVKWYFKNGIPNRLHI